MKVLNRKEILEIANSINTTEVMREAFSALSNGNAVIPPIGELLFEDPPGETHIKYGYIKNEDYYIIKIGSGFYKNPQINLSSSQGAMILASQKTGEIKAFLNDEGGLTDIRTAAAGALVSNHLAPCKVDTIGIIGTGIQARMQLEYFLKIHPCRKVIIWGRSKNKRDAYKQIFEPKGVKIEFTGSPKEVCQKAQVIITATAAESPLLKYEWLKKGTHITAIGSDTPHKQELHSDIIQNADLVVTDYREQSATRGEIHQAIKEGYDLSSTVEIGEILNQPRLGRYNDDQITVADLTGVAVQDIKIATAVYNQYLIKTNKHEYQNI